MPTYPYTCLDCHKRFEVFMSYSEYGKKPVTCSICGSRNTRRRLTRVRIARSEESRMDSLESGMGDLNGLENDPKALGRMMRRMGKEMGEELPSEFDDVVDRLEAGQSPEQIESDMPDLGASMPGGGDDDL